MDIDAKRLEYSRLGVEKIIRQSDCPATVMATMDRAEALKGADGVLITILQGGWMFGVRILRSPKSTAWTYAWATHAAHRESSVFCGRHR